METPLTSSDIKNLRHPDEDRFFLLYLAFYTPLLVFAFFVAFISYEVFILILLALIGLVWFIYAILRAYLNANTIRVSDTNFPEVLEIMSEVCRKLQYGKNVPVYIVKDKRLYRLASSILRMNCLVLESDVVEDILKDQNPVQLKWLIARFVGSRKLKIERMDIFIWVYDSLLNVTIFNILALPFERSNQLSGDNIGLALCMDLQEVEKVFSKLLVGKKLSRRVHLPGLLKQGEDANRNVWGQIGNFFSSQPYIITRYFNLLAFARKYLPNQYLPYISSVGEHTRQEIRNIIPDYYKDRPSVNLVGRQKVSVKSRSEARSQIKINRKQP